MRKQTLQVLAVFVLLGLASVLAWWAFAAAEQRRWESLRDQIKVGLTQQEVEDILGPPTDQSRHPQLLDAMWSWRRQDEYFTVYFDSQGLVCHFQSAPVLDMGQGRETIIEQIRWWVKSWF